MKQEPVAWIIQSKYGTPTIVWNGEPIKYTSNIVKQDDIPLYTTPQYRELSDEEIISCMGMEMKTLKEEALDFARALLKKASENNSEWIANNFWGESK